MRIALAVVALLVGLVLLVPVAMFAFEALRDDFMVYSSDFPVVLIALGVGGAACSALGTWQILVGLRRPISR
jgi:hypothetical protein